MQYHLRKRQALEIFRIVKTHGIIPKVSILIQSHFDTVGAKIAHETWQLYRIRMRMEIIQLDYNRYSMKGRNC